MYDTTDIGVTLFVVYTTNLSEDQQGVEKWKGKDIATVHEI